jgi:hypothetical protein
MTEDQTTERLLQLAGRRPAVAAARAARVRAAVPDAWRAAVRRRRIVRLVSSAAAMGAAAAAIALVVFVRSPQPDVIPAAVVATVERAEGGADLRAGAVIRAGEWMATSRASRVALRTRLGTSVRLDEQSRARLVSERTIEVTAGAVYLDTGDGAPALEVRTPLGDITDIGTQFEVRVMVDALRVRVRSGVVAVRRGGDSIRVQAATELTFTSHGAESRAVPSFAADWQWAAEVAPPFAIDGQRLTSFLDYLSRENGWTLSYEDRGLARDASEVVLHGSVDGLSPEAALSVAMTIADLSYKLERGELSICRASFC